jgi:hypothetical protein
MKQRILLSLTIVTAFILSACAAQHGSQSGGERVYGSVGVQIQSQDLSHISGRHIPD